MATNSRTKHTCLLQSESGPYDPKCPRCQELQLAKAAGTADGATVVVMRPPNPEYPVADRPVKLTEQQSQSGACRKVVEQNEDGTTSVSYIYAGKTYGGRLSFDQVRYNPQGLVVGMDHFYVLYPTVEDRDAAREAREEQRLQQEAQRRELRRLQAAGQSDLIGPNGLPMQTGVPGTSFFGGMVPMPPMR